VSRGLLSLLLTLAIWAVVSLCFLACFGDMWWKPLLHIWGMWQDEHIIVQGVLFVAAVMCTSYLAVYAMVSLVLRLRG